MPEALAGGRAGSRSFISVCFSAAGCGFRVSARKLARSAHERSGDGNCPGKGEQPSRIPILRRIIRNFFSSFEQNDFNRNVCKRPFAFTDKFRNREHERNSTVIFYTLNALIKTMVQMDFLLDVFPDSAAAYQSELVLSWEISDCRPGSATCFGTKTLFKNCRSILFVRHSIRQSSLANGVGGGLKTSKGSLNYNGSELVNVILFVQPLTSLQRWRFPKISHPKQIENRTLFASEKADPTAPIDFICRSRSTG